MGQTVKIVPDQSSGDFSPELVPVVDPELVPVFVSGASLPQAPALVLPDDFLSETLFGEVIDISELIPRLLSPSAEAGDQPVTDAQLVADATGAGFGRQDAGDVAAAASHAAGVLTILDDDDILASDQTICKLIRRPALGG